jgi:hypothetical protein
VARAACEYVSHGFKDGEIVDEICGLPAVDQLQVGGRGLQWLCAEHYDYMIRIKAMAKKLAQDFRNKHGRSIGE